MSKYRQAARIDENQTEIIKQLRDMGCTVQPGMDDILVGFRGKTYWYEIKDPEKTLKKDKTYKKGAIKDSQIKLAAEWQGHYKIVHCIEDILADINFDHWKDGLDD